MNNERVSAVLTRLHRQADATDHALLQEMKDRLGEAETPIEDVAAQMIADEAADYRQVYAGYSKHFLAVTPAYGRFLYAMARACRADRIVEFGTSMGVSTIYLAAAMRDNGGGMVIATELEPSKAARARAHLEDAGLSDLVDLRCGDALETLRDGGRPVDLALIDGAWSLYLPILKLIEPRLRAGSVVLAENAFAQDYLDYVREPANGYLAQTLAIDKGRGNEFAVRVA
nr:class I SAM-dependent methyltransferase [Sphingomonas hankookensis]